MTREEVREEILSIPNNSILAELPTGYGKTKLALDIVNDRVLNRTVTKILIVVPRLILINNWKEEIVKWGYEKWLNMFDFVTYVSLPKKLHTSALWDMVIFDEAHHLSERCRESIKDIIILNSVLLSATINRNMHKELKVLFPDLYMYKVTTKQAIQEEVLPDPKVFLIPLTLDNTKINCEIIKNKSQKTELVIPFSERFNYAKVKNRKIIIKCTQRQYYDDLSSMISWYKRKTFNETFKNLFLRKSGERLKWLSDQKTSYIKHLLDLLSKERTLTFCNSIPQTTELGKYCINSSRSKKENSGNLEKFNTGRIKHITACNMLDEGINLTNCRVGIYAVLNSSERIIIQKLGRLLRHPNPILIIPYYKGTRDEELVNKMMEDYNPELVTKITNLTELKL